MSSSMNEIREFVMGICKENFEDDSMLELLVHVYCRVHKIELVEWEALKSLPDLLTGEVSYALKIKGCET